MEQECLKFSELYKDEYVKKTRLKKTALYHKVIIDENNISPRTST